ncbi:MAG TPA: PadR family transcriptional regulator [Devosia sp.]|nr:PadR family transcriptional regulator [Devosia sp.]
MAFPHDDHWERQMHRAWHKMEAAGRRGWGGWGAAAARGGWGDWGGFGDNVRIGRMLASGDLRLVALYLIEQQPRHGYDLIKALEERTGGLYSPSPGVIYPALTYLEEANFVTSTAEANKRLYTITDEGRTHLNDNREAVESTLANLKRMGEQFEKVRERRADARREFDAGPRDRDMADVGPEVNDARRDLKDAIRHAARQHDPETLRRLAEILRRAARDIRDAGAPPPPPPHDDIDI